jgi:hypothetical protein
MELTLLCEVEPAEPKGRQVPLTHARDEHWLSNEHAEPSATRASHRPLTQLPEAHPDERVQAELSGWGKVATQPAVWVLVPAPVPLPVPAPVPVPPLTTPPASSQMLPTQAPEAHCAGTLQ